ncbi:MAG: tRNA preQ1(34) S-adenosylmethionine ribosyltransferase-isomerase QueA [Eubacteriales bacterium]|nr:tRNA preQ1(34) S-adenosylmethionine ribosyltransferase-isomerase QueA [Eubacteriales bacterium]MDD4582731.1 tRNA preQ1(34) S-adenosylmethionine ribosyltransferase-isomerase QueA [Eubacteriales bacterium]
MHINEFDYFLPPELIAQYPSEKRDHSRLMVLDRSSGTIEHKRFHHILDYLNPGDCLVLNNSKVIPARLLGIKEKTGAKVEFLLIKRKGENIWETMVKPGKKIKPGDRVCFSKDPLLIAEVLDFSEDGTRIVEFCYQGEFSEILYRIGRMPLPPYIQRESQKIDKDRYQTVYCREEGSVAAPTAGLHFTEELLGKAKEKGIKIAHVTLHVGIGTFRPVKCENIEDHKMHFEEYEIDEENRDIINETKIDGGRIIAVGTTSTRTLESAALSQGLIKAGWGSTGIFIYPGYKFQVIDSLITNFHLPKSTLLMLVSAFYNQEKILEAYDEAVKEEYRFFSYGDAMLIL